MLAGNAMWPLRRDKPASNQSQIPTKTCHPANEIDGVSVMHHDRRPSESRPSVPEAENGVWFLLNESADPLVEADD